MLKTDHERTKLELKNKKLEKELKEEKANTRTLARNIKDHKAERTKLKNKIAKCREKLKKYEMYEMSKRIGEPVSDDNSDAMDVDDEVQNFEVVNNEEVTSADVNSNKVGCFY